MKNRITLIIVSLVVFAIVGYFVYYQEDKKQQDSQEVLETFNIVDVDGYLDILKKDEINFIYIGRPTCAYCQKLVPILIELVKESNLEINYLNTDKVTKQEEYDKFMNSNKFFKEGKWGTPLIIAVKNNEIIDKSLGLVTKEKLVEFIEKNSEGKNEKNN